MTIPSSPHHLDHHLATATEFEAALFDRVDAGWISTWRKVPGSRDSKTLWAPHDQPTLAAAQAITDPFTAHAYVGVALRREQLDAHHRGGVEDCLTLPALFADVDTTAGQHAAENLPTPEQGLDFCLNALGLPPSIIVNSGGGYQPYWLFEEAQDVTELATRHTLERWRDTLKRLAADRGWHLDSVFNTDRVLRVPGSYNVKPENGEPRLVTIEHANYARRYGLDDIEEALDAYTPPAPTSAGPRIPYVGAQRPGDAFSLRHTCDEILTRYGFRLVGTHHNENRYSHPWKDARRGEHSVIVHTDSGNATNFSSTVEQHFPAFRLTTDIDPDTGKGYSYSPFGLYTAISHGGDWAAATKALSEEGYGERYVEDLTWVPPLVEEDPQEKLEPEAEWPAPTGFDVKVGHGPPFPLDALPAWMHANIIDISKDVSVPVDYAAGIGLATLASVTMGRVVFDLSERRTNLPLNLFIVMAGESGQAKSPPHERMMAPLYAFIESRKAEMKKSRNEAEAKVTAARKEAEELEKKATASASGGADELARQILAAKEKLDVAEEDLARYPDPEFVLNDTTLEALADQYEACGEIAAVFDDDGGIIPIMAGLYTQKGKDAPVGTVIHGYDGSPLTILRRNRGKITIKRPLLTIGLMTQPHELAKLGTHGYLSGKGVVARFLPSIPADTRGYMDHYRQLQPYDRSIRTTYDNTFIALAQRLSRYGQPVRLHTTPEALHRWAQWCHEVELRLRPGRDLRGIVAWVKKILTATARVAALLHLADHPHDHTPEVGVEAFERAFRLADYWIAHALVLKEAWDNHDESKGGGLLRIAPKIVQWALDEGDLDEETGSVVVAWSKLRSRLHDNHTIDGKKVDKTQALEVLELLVERGWARVDADFWTWAKAPTQGRQSRPVTFHPDAEFHLTCPDAEDPDVDAFGFLDLPPEPPVSDPPEPPNPLDGSIENGGKRGRGVKGENASTTTTEPNLKKGVQDFISKVVPPPPFSPEVGGAGVEAPGSLSVSDFADEDPEWDGSF